VAQYGDVFRRYDADDSGSLNVDEVSEAAADYTVDGQISINKIEAVEAAFTRPIEFAPSAPSEKSRALDLPDADLKSQYGSSLREFDADGSGEISADEVLNAVAQFGSVPDQETADATRAVIAAYSRNLQFRTTPPSSSPPSSPSTSNVEFEISEGWSLVSAPGGVSSLRSVIRDECSVGTSGRTVWRARADVGGYAEPGPIRSTGGYWVNLESSCSFSTFAADEDASYTEFEESGLYMVSVPEATSLDSVAGSCSFNQFTEYSGPVLELNGDEYQGLSSSTELSPTKGYWVGVQEPCKMGFDAGGSAPIGPPPGPQ
jgi:Ca2+-binding EF-hand superfamily protein